jgi:hypothetical protein
MTAAARAVGRFLLRGTRRAALTLVGFALLALGVAGLVLPVLPGWLLIIAGFAVLAREYSWAHSALVGARRHAARGGATVRSLARRRQPAVIDVADGIVVDLIRMDGFGPDDDYDATEVPVSGSGRTA